MLKCFDDVFFTPKQRKNIEVIKNSLFDSNLKQIFQSNSIQLWFNPENQSMARALS